MTTIRAVIRNGRIEVSEPINLPDGTELTIPIPVLPARDILDEDVADSPEAIEAWIRWYDSLEPVSFTQEERAAREAARQEDKRYELAEWAKRSERIES